jgi:glutathione peroxidase
MKTIILTSLILSLFALTNCARVESRPKTMNANTQVSTTSFYDFTLNTIDGTAVKMESFKGKKLLLVNVASKCGYTPQYADLQQLHEKYGDKILILGFPANDFGSQEPGSNEDIASFCQKNYGVSFQMFEKIAVTGDNQHPLYKWLSSKELNGWNDKAPSWNFCKYLVSENGELLKFFNSSVKPLSDEIVGEI